MNNRILRSPRLALAAAAVFATACTSAPPSSVNARLSSAQFVLLGEVHDNAVQHAARAELLHDLLADGRRTTVVFEQMGRAQDPAVAAAPRESQAVIEAGKLDQKGWRWPLHKPLFDAALAGGARITGGNLERDDVRRVVREGALALPADVAALQARTPWTPEQEQALVRNIDEGHCGSLPATMHAPMALAQRARDAAMAQAMLNARASGATRVVLIAGNGHVRRDLAVPLYLQAAGVPAADIVSQAYLETDEKPAPYDAVVRTAAAEREDPCKAFKR